MATFEVCPKCGGKLKERVIKVKEPLGEYDFIENICPECDEGEIVFLATDEFRPSNFEVNIEEGRLRIKRY